MTSDEINCTITSSDPSNYSLIRTSLPIPSTKYSEFMVTGLSTLSSFIILKYNDYMDVEIYVEPPNIVKHRVYYCSDTISLNRNQLI